MPFALIGLAYRLVWLLIKGALLLILVHFFLTTVIEYPSFNENRNIVGASYEWVYSVVTKNYIPITLFTILFYSWRAYRLAKESAARVEQIEVIAFSQLDYFDYQPVTNISRISSGKELLLAFFAGFLSNIFGANNPLDTPWSAKAIRSGRYVDKEVKLRTDVNPDAD